MDDSLDVKIGQMILVGFRGLEVQPHSPVIQAIRAYHLGGVWLVDHDSPLGYTLGNIQSPVQVKKLIADLQAAARIPLFIAIDAEGGQIIRLKEKFGFPRTCSAQYLGEKNDPAFTFQQAHQMAIMLKALGINFNFAPVLDLNLQPDSPALGQKARCFSADPEIVLRHARQFIHAHHQVGVPCCLKHFPGHGSARADSHLGLVDVSQTWQRRELLPYQQLIQEKLADAILTAHVFIKQFDAQFPATLSQPIITQLLRTELAYSGLIITDDLNMGAIQKNFPYEQALELAINAGVDILLHANVDQYQADIVPQTVAIIKHLLKSGRIQIEQIERAFQRILAVKQK